MAFNSFEFILFLASVVIANYFIPKKFRILFLSIASVFFVTYYSVFSGVGLIFSSFLNFFLGKKVKNSFVILLFGLFFNVACILLFNYFVMMNNGLNYSLSVVNFNVNSFVLVVGISFYSLQNISYLVEIHSDRGKPEQKFINYFLFNGFFTKIVSGPILQSSQFFTQLNSIVINKNDLIAGFNRLLLGLFKKMVIADRLAPAVSSVFDHGNHYSGLTTVTGICLFTVQLYFDFSGYVDMACGASRMLGIKLPENFNFPLRATSVSEFWRRWHITLINWFTTIIFYPIVYKLRKHKKMAATIGIAATFLISGIWHGIGFTFLAWAVCHAIYLIVELFTKNARAHFKKNIPEFIFKPFSAFIVFGAVCFSHVFFRSASIDNAIQLIKNCSVNVIPDNYISDFIAPLAVGGHQEERFNFYISILLMILFLLFERKIVKVASSEKYNLLFVTTVILLIFLLGVFNGGERFIYMQF